MPEHDYITLEETAAILRVSMRQVHNHIARGRLRTKKEGRRRMVLRDDALKLAEELHSAERQLAQPMDEVLDVMPELRMLMNYIERLHADAKQMAHRIGTLEAELQMLREQRQQQRGQ